MRNSSKCGGTRLAGSRLASYAATKFITSSLLPAMVMRTAALLASMVAGAQAHGSMIMPPSRNSVDAELPPWANGKFPFTGLIEP